MQTIINPEQRELYCEQETQLTKSIGILNFQMKYIVSTTAILHQKV